MKRQRRISEMSQSGNCGGCPFLTNGCTVPGGTCIYRQVQGAPGHYVGDVLENVGIIQPGWDVVLAASSIGPEAR